MSETRWGPPTAGPVAGVAALGVAGVTFTPTGPDTEITIQCTPGSTAVVWINGGLSGPGRGAHMLLPPSAKKTVAIVPDGLSAEKLRREGYAGMKTIGQYLATTPVGKAIWSTAVYSGTCKSALCPPPMPPSVKGEK